MQNNSRTLMLTTISLWSTCVMTQLHREIRASTIRLLSVHYRYRKQLIRIDTVSMLYRYIWKYSFTLHCHTIKQKT